MSYISRNTWIYGVFIIVSASFLQQILFLLNDIIGTKAVQNIFYAVCFLSTVATLSYLLKQNLQAKSYIIIVCLVLLAFILMYIQPYFAEKTHVILYGILGYSSLKDTSKNLQGIKYPIIYALLFTLIINISDELFQAILPYRVGEVYDILTNFFSTTFGFLFYLSLKD